MRWRRRCDGAVRERSVSLRAARHHGQAPTELPVFEELFELYFSGLGEIIKQASQAVQQALSMSDQEFQKFLEEVEEMLKKEGRSSPS